MLKGYWKLNGNSNDSSGNGYTGTDTAITYGAYDSPFGYCASFNGSSSKILFGNILNPLNSSWCVDLYFKSNDTDHDLWGEIVTKNGYDVYGYRFLTYYGELYGVYRNTANNPNYICDTNWHHARISRIYGVSNETTNLYIDDMTNVLATITGSHASLSNTQNLAFGCVEDSGGNFLAHFNGYLCEVRIYNTALPPVSINSNLLMQFK